MTSKAHERCEEWTAMLHGLLDGELDAVHVVRCEEHLALCSPCSEELNALRDLRVVLARDGVRWRAPAALRDRVLALLARQRSAPTARSGGLRGTDKDHGAWRRISVGFRRWRAVPAGFGLAASLALVFALVPPRGGAGLPEELVAGHVRSLLADHLTDVTTSDQHRVKPWFAGKTGFAPPVVDLSNRGFPLVGGRLDYIESRVVAALVYNRRGHVINLFVWPATAAPEAALARDGYNLIHWEQASLAFWAISDLNAVELREFRDNFANEIPR